MPWRYSDNLLILFFIWILGFLLETSTNGAGVHAPTFPYNIILLICFLIFNWSVFKLNFFYFFRHLLLSTPTVLVLIAGYFFLCLLGGFFPQLEVEIYDGPRLSGISHIFRSWYTLFTLLLIMMSLLQSSLKRAKNFRQNKSYLLNHLGIFLVLVGGIFGSGDLKRHKITLVQDEWIKVHQTPFTLNLEKFVIEKSPQKYISSIRYKTSEEDKEKKFTLEVNRPVTFQGWKIYQISYDDGLGKPSNTAASIVELVNDPWLPVVYSGLLMILMGISGLFFSKKVTSTRKTS